MNWHRIHAGLAPEPAGRVAPRINDSCARFCGEPRAAGRVFCAKHDAEVTLATGTALDGYREAERVDLTVVRTFPNEGV